MDLPIEEPEVFETSDIDSDIEETRPLAANPDIDESTFDITKSVNKFNNQFVNGKINFDYVSDLDLTNSGYKVYKEEDHKQKLNRITRELEELEVNERNEDYHKIRHLVDIKDKDLDNINEYKIRINKLFDNLDMTASHSESSTSVSKDVTNESEIIRLDKKLSQIESQLGENLLNSTNSIDNMLNDLTKKVAIINNPDYKINDINRSIESLVDKLETIKRQNPNLSQLKYDKLDDLVNMLPQLHNFKRLSPLLLKRLKILKDIHTNTGSAISFADNLDKIINELYQDLRQWDNTLQIIDGKLDKNMESFNNSKTEISSWVDNLSNKLDIITSKTGQ